MFYFHRYKYLVPDDGKIVLQIGGNDHMNTLVTNQDGEKIEHEEFPWGDGNY